MAAEFDPDALLDSLVLPPPADDVDALLEAALTECTPAPDPPKPAVLDRAVSSTTPQPRPAADPVPDAFAPEPPDPPTADEFHAENFAPPLEDVLQATAAAQGLAPPTLPPEAQEAADYDPVLPTPEAAGDVPVHTYTRTEPAGQAASIRFPGLHRFSTLDEVLGRFLVRSIALEVSVVPDMGLGLRVGRDIDAGEVIFHEKAAFAVVSSDASPAAFLPAYLALRAGPLHAALGPLLAGLPRDASVSPAESQALTAAFNALPFAQRGGLAAADLLAAYGGFRGNGLEKRVQFVDGRQERPAKANVHCLFPLASLLNHSCAPNTGCTINLLDVPTPGQGMASESVQLVCRATRRIPRGAALHMSYLDPQELHGPPAQRRAALLSARGFDCRCEACRAELQPGASTGGRFRLCWRR
eukprot:EG_transcript_11344